MRPGGAPVGRDLDTTVPPAETGCVLTCCNGPSAGGELDHEPLIADDRNLSPRRPAHQPGPQRLSVDLQAGRGRSGVLIARRGRLGEQVEPAWIDPDFTATYNTKPFISKLTLW
jgi:hypothetical protein